MWDGQRAINGVEILKRMGEGFGDPNSRSERDGKQSVSKYGRIFLVSV